MVRLEYEHSITVTFANSSESRDLNNFISLLKKCNKEAKRSGFRSMFTTEEKIFVRSLHDSLVDNNNDSAHIYAERGSIIDS